MSAADFKVSAFCGRETQSAFCVEDDGALALNAAGYKTCVGCGWFLVELGSVTTRPTRMSQTPPESAPRYSFETLMSDLDRCRHGRHVQDNCWGCRGYNDGNPHYPAAGTRIGTSLRGTPIVVPPVQERGNPDAWYGLTGQEESASSVMQVRHALDVDASTPWEDCLTMIHNGTLGPPKGCCSRCGGRGGDETGPCHDCRQTGHAHAPEVGCS